MEAFANRFNNFDLRLPIENGRERRNGSLPYGRLYHVFGEEGGREYLEYYTHHRMGDSHGKINEDGSIIAGQCSVRDSPVTKRSSGAESKRKRRCSDGTGRPSTT